MDRTDVKDRGKKHVRMKNRNKNKKYTKETTQLPPRQEALPTNHDRYELSDSDDETVGADFSLLASAPMSIGGHFQFKRDSLQTAQTSVDSSSNYLQSLDAEVLSYSLKTIPFYIRCNVNSKYITEKYKDALLQDAEKSKEIYQEYLKHSQKASSVGRESEEICKIIKNAALEDKNLKKDRVKEDPEKTELEDWLDDVLNS